MKKILTILLLWNACLLCAYSSESKLSVPLMVRSDDLIAQNIPNSKPIQSSAQQPGVVTGQITDKKGEPLAGVSIRIEGLPTVAISDVNGRYSMKVPNEKVTLVFTYIGFIPQKVVVTNKKEVDVILDEDSKMINEVVITALGISRESKTLPYARQSVDVESMTQARESNIVNALDGQVAGLIVTTGGQPTGSSSIQIRGTKSITGENQPLFVLDGVPIDNSSFQDANVDYGNNAMDINPNDIGSIEVLKGPNAAALYGSKAANGAIIITTKKAAGGDKYYGITLNANYMWTSVQEFIQYQNIYGGGGNLASAGTVGSNLNVAQQAIIMGYDNKSWGAPMLGQRMLTYGGKLVSYIPQPDNTRAFYQTGLNQAYNIALDKSDKVSSFRLSYTFQKANDIMMNQNLRDKHNFSFVGRRDFKKFTIDFTTNYTNDHVVNRTPGNYDAKSPYFIYTRMLRSMSIDYLTPWKGPDNYELGSNLGNTEDNPFWLLYENKNEDHKNRLIGSVVGTVNLSKDLTFRAKVAPDMEFRDSYDFRQMFSSSDKDGYYYNYNANYYTWNYEGLLMYKKNFKPFSLVANIGTSSSSAYRLDRNTKINTLSVPDLPNDANAGNYPTVTENLVKRKSVGIFATGNIGYKDFLYLDVTGRNDWSSTLPKGKNSFFYPSIGGAYIFTKNAKNVLSFGKLRASWAQVGNDPNPYLLETKMYFAGYLNGQPYVSRDNSMKNANLKPEITTSTELGVDLRFLDERLSVDATVYKAASKNQIFQPEIPKESGFNKQYVNAGEIDNTGIELSVRATPIKGNFTWSVFANWSKNKNEVVSLIGDLKRLQFNSIAGITVNAEVGEPFGTLRGVEWAHDAKGNTIITPGGNFPITILDQKLGNAQPDWTGSTGTSLSYKGFNLSVLLTVRHGGQIYSNTMNQANNTGVSIASLEGRYDYLLHNVILGESGTEILGVNTAVQGGKGVYEDYNAKGYLIKGFYPLVDQNGKNILDADGNYIAGQPSTAYINPNSYWTNNNNIPRSVLYDATYVKLKQISLTYNIPKKWFKGALKSGSISANARNLWTIYKKTPQGIDPESAPNGGMAIGIENGGSFPYATYGFDVRVSF
ncbi:MAG: SusC/RagA family TonB-linked outer membrane protein [Bacteroidales bacterium]|nr:SusC/RagA family TonB-linked outer membrane protein [Bacteroidales bacterium]